jgi:hypothetical protein
MTVAAYTTLTISDGTTTANLVDGTNYALVAGGWGPSVAPLRVSTLGGSGPYADVVEQITVDVRGSTGATCLANLAKLSQLLDQAERWARGEPVAAVLLACQPQGSTLAAALSCVILGRAGESALSTPATFNDLLMCYEIPDVQISFQRRGQWLAAEETKTVVASAATEIPTVCAVTFDSAAAIASPAYVLAGGLNVNKNASFLLIADAANKIAILEAESFGTSAPWSSVADSANNARGGSLLRYTPAGTTTVRNTLNLAVLPANVRRLNVYMALRNNSATVTWRLRAVGNVDGTTEVSTPEIIVDSSTTVPRIVFLGTLAFVGTLVWIGFDVTASSISGSPTLDFDYMVLHVMESKSGTIAFTPVISSSGGGVIADARALTQPSPIASGYDALPVALPYAGDAWVQTIGAVLAVALLMTGGHASNYWRCTTALGVVSQMSLSAKRRLAYLTPQ